MKDPEAGLTRVQQILGLRAPRGGERPLLVREAARLCRVVDGRARWHMADDALPHTAPLRLPQGRRQSHPPCDGSLRFARLSGQLCFYKQMVYFSHGWKMIEKPIEPFQLWNVRE